jgi:propionyl-CoA carboxylase alpha chain
MIPRNVPYHKLHVIIGNQDYLVTVSQYDKDFVEIVYQGEKIKMKHSYIFGQRHLKGIINGIFDISIKIKYLDGGFVMASSGSKEVVFVLQQHVFDFRHAMFNKKDTVKSNKFTAPITGKINKIVVKQGDNIDAGQVMFTIEAMKMENNITADFDTKIAQILKNEGDFVLAGEEILRFN